MADIDVNVKTLDSSNHSFSVKDDVTVLDFKKKIEPTVSVESSRQRLIYCGKVLADEKKLSEYDLNGKTVHLVLKNPNSSSTNNPSNSTQSTSRQGQPDSQQGGPSGSTVYSGQWTIAWPPPGAWPPIVLRGAPVVPGQHPPHQRSRSAAPSTTQASSMPTSTPSNQQQQQQTGQPVPSNIRVSNTPMQGSGPRPAGVTVSSSTMTIPIAQWTLGLPLGAGGAAPLSGGTSWGPQASAIQMPAVGLPAGFTQSYMRQRTSSGPPSGPPTSGSQPPTNNPVPPQQQQPSAATNNPVRPQMYQQFGRPAAPQQPVPPTGSTASGNSYLLGAFQVPQDVFDPSNLNQIVQDVMSQLGILGRNATVMSRTSEDGSAVDVHINLGQISTNNEIRNRIAVIRRLLVALNQGLEQLDQSLAALDGSGPPPPPMNIPNINDLLASVGQPPIIIAPATRTTAPPQQPQRPPPPQQQRVPNVTNITPSAPQQQQPAQQVLEQQQAAVPSTSSSASSVVVHVNEEDKKKNKEEAEVNKSESKRQGSVDLKVPKVASSPTEDSDAEFFDADQEEAESQEVRMATNSPPTTTTGSSSSSSDGSVPLIGSESWHREVPSSWIPIISADIDLQRGTTSHEPLSEAYLNVLPKKKRKTGE